MNFDFEISLNSLMGPREHFHVMECQVFGFDEVYYQHPFTKKQIGVACEGCNYVYTFDSKVDSRSIIQNRKHPLSDLPLCDYGRA